MTHVWLTGASPSAQERCSGMVLPSCHAPSLRGFEECGFRPSVLTERVLVLWTVQMRKYGSVSLSVTPRLWRGSSREAAGTGLPSRTCGIPVPAMLPDIQCSALEASVAFLRGKLDTGRALTGLKGRRVGEGAAM